MRPLATPGPEEGGGERRHAASGVVLENNARLSQQTAGSVTDTEIYEDKCVSIRALRMSFVKNYRKFAKDLASFANDFPIDFLCFLLKIVVFVKILCHTLQGSDSASPNPCRGWLRFVTSLVKIFFRFSLNKCRYV